MAETLSSHEFVLSVQRFSHPALDFFFLGVTHLGDAAFIIAAAAALWWTWDKRAAARLLSIFLLSCALTYFLKNAFSLPRPDPGIVRSFGLSVAVNESFPSGHALGSTLFWGFLALRIRRPWMNGLAATLILLIGFSRIYLGVHFMRDVLAGTVLGAAFLAAALWSQEAASKSLSRARLPAVFPWISAFSIPYLLARLLSDPRVSQTMGLLAGIWLGILAERQWVSFDPARARFSRPLRIALGIAAGSVLAAGTFALAPTQAVFFLSHILLGLFIAFFYPWLLTVNTSHSA
jgi:membrane-associated phospholipid phosphatase